ncbi:cytochrome c oxidase subunit 6A2, mitochondrial-like [Biomphalaria glabrata]|uniref:Cytochrome c oxidase subunit 6A2, mitochondrial-like n=2 Tax=Biomphalaria TaxID=6525 RepID=A0A9W2YJ42_BIOGL|nr:cytochrome c oxidase subunit 6A2, mitochondrial-like [Biomphalaria glabrata]KAI8753646.1 cytochrome c oxidase subunit 6A; mitochondrial [Biomphalaria glabrata]KAK0055028.1 cytochrome c oxidase subunit 6A mitochondrial [Biomphalaria pfeifferi]
MAYRQLFNVALQNSRRSFASSAGHSAHGESSKTWRNAFYIVGLPVVGLVYYNAFYLMPQHPERPEFVPYPHLRIRNRPYPWGDGDHTLFHNKYYNATSKGYDEGSEDLNPAKHHH